MFLMCLMSTGVIIMMCLMSEAYHNAIFVPEKHRFNRRIIVIAQFLPLRFDSSPISRLKMMRFMMIMMCYMMFYDVIMLLCDVFMMFVMLL